MSVYVALLFILLLVPSKFFWRSNNQDYISKDGIEPIKGLFILLVFASHFIQHVKLGGAWNEHYVWLRGHLGQLVVTPFLFYSGYGVLTSVCAKGETYLRTFPVRRILSLLFKFDIAIGLFLLEMALFGRYFPIPRILKSLVGWESVGNSNWYILVILIMYALVYLAFKMVANVPRQAKAVAAMSVLTLFSALAVAILSRYQASYYYNTIFAFVAGGWFCVAKDGFEKWFRGNPWAYWLSLLVSMTTVWVISGYRNICFWHQVLSMVFPLVIVLVTVRLQSRNRFLEYCGMHLFSLYILQRLPMHALGRVAWMKSHVIAYFVLSLLITFALSAVFDACVARLWNWLCRRVPGGR